MNRWVWAANERRRYIVTSSLIGWAHTQGRPGTIHHNDVKRALWCLKSPENRLFLQQFAHTTKMIHQSAASPVLCEETSTANSGFPTHRASNAVNVYMSWRHHVGRHSCPGYYDTLVTSWLPDKAMAYCHKTLHSDITLIQQGLSSTRLM